MDTLELVKSLNIPEQKQLEALCEFIDSIQFSNWWDYYGGDQFDQWAERWRNYESNDQQG